MTKLTFELISNKITISTITTEFFFIKCIPREVFSVFDASRRKTTGFMWSFFFFYPLISIHVEAKHWNNKPSIEPISICTYLSTLNEQVINWTLCKFASVHTSRVYSKYFSYVNVLLFLWCGMHYTHRHWIYIFMLKDLYVFQSWTLSSHNMRLLFSLSQASMNRTFSSTGLMFESV